MYSEEQATKRVRIKRKLREKGIKGWNNKTPTKKLSFLLHDEDVKAIDVVAKVWTQRTYNHSYYTAKIVINFGMDSEVTLKLGENGIVDASSGTKYEFDSLTKLQSKGFLPTKYNNLSIACRKEGIWLRRFYDEGHTKKEVKNFMQYKGIRL